MRSGVSRLREIRSLKVMVVGLAHAQSDEDSSASQQLEGTVEPDSSAAANDATSDENASYLSGGGFDSAGDTGGAGTTAAISSRTRSKPRRTNKEARNQKVADIDFRGRVPL